MKLSSKTNLSFEVKINNVIAFQKVLMGLRLDETTSSLIGYTNFLKMVFKFSKINFLHVAPFYNPGMNPYIGNPITGYPLGKIYSEDNWKRGAEQIEAIEQELINEIIDDWIPFDDIVKECMVREGSAVEELIAYNKEYGADLIIIGRSEDSNRNQITAKNIIRQTNADVLVVPEHSKPKLERILVPFDYSPSAIKALKTAVIIKKSMPIQPIVQVLNIYDSTDYSLLSLEPANKDIPQYPEEGLQNFLAAYLPEIRNEVHPISIKKDKKNIAEYLLEKSEAFQSDLIIMGAKGHSKLELLLLGSTTERFLNKNSRIPTLVVK